MTVDASTPTATVPVAEVGRSRDPRRPLHVAWAMLAASVGLGLVMMPLLRSAAEVRAWAP